MTTIRDLYRDLKFKRTRPVPLWWRGVNAAWWGYALTAFVLYAADGNVAMVAMFAAAFMTVGAIRLVPSLWDPRPDPDDFVNQEKADAARARFAAAMVKMADDMRPLVSAMAEVANAALTARDAYARYVEAFVEADRRTRPLRVRPRRGLR